jgi:hypothetical protein
LDQITKTVKELGCTFVCFDRFAQIFRHLTIPSYRIRSLQSEVVVYDDLDLLLGAEVAFRRLDGGVAEQELDLFDISAVLAAELMGWSAASTPRFLGYKE